MDALKKLPIKYKGELTNIRLINFSVDFFEVEKLLPSSIRVRSINNRALISMVDVSLKKMRPSFLPSSLSFNYRHIAFRLLIDDGTYNPAQEKKGIFFLKSFTDNSLITLGGSILTSYRLSNASINESKGTTKVVQGNNLISYSINDLPAPKNDSLKQIIGNIDRAYSIIDHEVMMIKILREKWPLQWINCTHFETNFFKTARLEGAFKVNEPIYYTWLPPQKPKICE